MYFQLIRKSFDIFVAKHVPGVDNSAADMLSRLQLTEFQARFPHMEHEPTQIPLELVRLWRMFKII